MVSEDLEKSTSKRKSVVVEGMGGTSRYVGYVSSARMVT